MLRSMPFGLRATLRAADEDVAQAVATLRPVIDYTARASANDSRLQDDFTGSLSLTASWLLYDFGRSQLAIDLQKETVLATREALKNVEQQVLLRAVAAYLQVRRQNAFVGLRENNVRLISEQLRAARDRFEVGEGTSTDVAQAEARLAQANSNLTQALGDLAAARAHVGDGPALAVTEAGLALAGEEVGHGGIGGRIGHLTDFPCQALNQLFDFLDDCVTGFLHFMKKALPFCFFR